MSKPVKKNSEINDPNKADIYREFILWTAMPHSEKVNLGLETQTAFVEFYKIGVNTPMRWKQRPDFEERVDKILKMWSIDKTPDVIHGIYRAAVKGNPMSQLLWLQYFKKFNPKSEVEHTHRIELGVNDIRRLIEALPDELKAKHHANLRELLDDAVAVRHDRGTEDVRWDERPPLLLQGETHNDAQDVPEQKANAVARCDSARLCSYMEWGQSTRDNKGTARWR